MISGLYVSRIFQATSLPMTRIAGRSWEGHHRGSHQGAPAGVGSSGRGTEPRGKFLVGRRLEIQDSCSCPSQGSIIPPSNAISILDLGPARWVLVIEKEVRSRPYAVGVMGLMVRC